MPTLREIFSNIADAIRTKTGKSDSIYPVDMASEIEGISSGGGYKLEKMPSGAVSSFNDGTDLPLNKLKVSIEPIQDLHGYDAPWVGGAGKNKLNITDKTTTQRNVTITVKDGEIKLNGTVDGEALNYIFQSGLDLPNNTYTFSVNGALPSNTSFSIQTSGGNKSCVNNVPSMSFTESISGICWIFASAGTVFNNVVLKPQIEVGSQPTTFAPYSNICPISGWSAVDVTVADDVDNPTTTETITIQLGDTYYGGELDVVNGVLTVDKGYIASYNGETLPSTWISDRDVYAEGTAPTTGAEVVYKLANSVTYHLTPVQIRTLVGNNNIWADTGDIINGEYFKGAESSETENIYYIKNIRIECEVI